MLLQQAVAEGVERRSCYPGGERQTLGDPAPQLGGAAGEGEQEDLSRGGQPVLDQVEGSLDEELGLPVPGPATIELRALDIGTALSIQLGRPPLVAVTATWMKVGREQDGRRVRSGGENGAARCALRTAGAIAEKTSVACNPWAASRDSAVLCDQVLIPVNLSGVTNRDGRRQRRQGSGAVAWSESPRERTAARRSKPVAET